MEKIEPIPIEFISDFRNREKINELVEVVNQLIERYNIETKLRENSEPLRNLSDLLNEYRPE